MVILIKQLHTYIMPINLNEPLRTRCGKPVTIISTEARGRYPVIGYIGDEQDIKNWTKDGLSDKHSPLDLENVEQTVERYLTIFKDHTTGQYYAAPFLHEELIKASKYARDMSDYQINKTCVARLKLAFIEGQFDDI